MMYLPDFKDAITDYLTNSGQDPEGWDVDGAAREMRDRYPEAESTADIDADDFIEILEDYDLGELEA
ncbi:MAG: hypothetical protein MR415_08330 [Coriobacteriaceae bacterium]|uniref:hypothetical protein n=1 Tax=Tractidigestivibacter sp. TaxID=2847320 RepID=UPI002A90D083|nr:hypothetical protein [Tractidigestivibacter sp.]MCI6548636.1 hypothetical protein [Coriobacteriaceae bacterium]MDD7584712.1 hypothetical protein [Coriobacteriaceae bacterium]MDY5272514.1 hypothetical protein [Tractidigestivibacter sp.]